MKLCRATKILEAAEVVRGVLATELNVVERLCVADRLDQRRVEKAQPSPDRRPSAVQGLADAVPLHRSAPEDARRALGTRIGVCMVSSYPWYDRSNQRSRCADGPRREDRAQGITGAGPTPSSGAAGAGRMKTFLPLMTAVEAQEAADRGAVALLPLGTVEGNGPHQLLGADYLMAEAVAEEVSARTHD